MADSQQIDAFGNPIDPTAQDDSFAPIYLDPTQRNPTQLPGDGRTIQTFSGDSAIGDPNPGALDPPPATTPPDVAPPDPNAPGTARQKNPGPAVDPATGQPNLTGTLTGPAPASQPLPAPSQPTAAQSGPDYSGLQSILEQMMAGQVSDRAAVAAQRESLQATLDRVIKSAERPVSASDTEIAGPTTAFNAEGQRARRMMQEQLAQEAAATGKTTGSTDAAVGRSFEDLGNATGSYEGGLMTNELKSRRDQLQAALTTGAGMLSAQDQSRLSEELDALNGQIALQSGKRQNQQFYDQLGFDMGSQSNSLDKILADMISQGGGSVAA